MSIHVFDTKAEMGAAAAAAGASLLHVALESKKSAALIVATGASQFELLAHLSREKLSWPKITGFHLDEYIGLPIAHDASFRKYLWERFVSQLPLPMAAFHYLDGEADAEAECGRVGALIEAHEIDVAFVGIGENGHLAFNDPPADFEVETPYLIVALDEACRRQQFGEGWFPDMDSVPKRAISMSVRQILKARTIVCTVPDRRKAEAVRNALQGEVTAEVPASILQKHPDCRFFLDSEAAALL